MSRQEQAALIAWVNSFRPTRRVTSFDSLADGRAFMDVLTTVDASHFKAVPSRGPGAGPSSPDNWVLKTNALKRLYRLITSYPLPAPHHPLSTSTLSEPPYSAIVKSPSSPDGIAGLVQLARTVLCVAVWAPGNEKVIAKIQGLGEGHMAELMRGIEEVMASMPPEDETDSGSVGGAGESMMRKISSNGSGGTSASASRRGSPVKKGETLRIPSPPGALRAERDRLTVENDELRSRFEQMTDQLSDLTASLDEANGERDDALARLTASREAGHAALSKSQGAGSDMESLKSELLRAEEQASRLEEELAQKTVALEDAERTMAALQEEAAEAVGMRDQLDEYRHLQIKLQKSENLAEKYKKKLEESANLRREMRNLEEENAQLLAINTGLEGELRGSGQSKSLLEEHRSRIQVLERKVMEQTLELSTVQMQLETAQNQLHDTEVAHERDKEELQLYQEKEREVELGSIAAKSSLEESKGTLDDELVGLGSPGETKTDLKLRIRKLERQVAGNASTSTAQDRQLETVLSDAQRARDRYQAEYLASHRETLWLQAKVDAILRGKSGSGEMASALKVELDEVNFEKKKLEEEIKRVRAEQEGVKRELKEAQEELELVDLDQSQVLQSLRKMAQADLATREDHVRDLRDQIEGLKEKDALRLEEIKLLLSDKIDLQAMSIGEKDQALKREREYGDLRSRLSGRETSGQPAESEPDYAAFEEAQKSYEAQIAGLRSELDALESSSEAAEKRYRTEQDLMLSAWHDLGSRVVKDQLGAVLGSQTKRSQPRAAPIGWLGRQRRAQEDAIFAR